MFDLDRVDAKYEGCSVILVRNVTLGHQWMGWGECNKWVRLFQIYWKTLSSSLPFIPKSYPFGIVWYITDIFPLRVGRGPCERSYTILNIKEHALKPMKWSGYTEGLRKEDRSGKRSRKSFLKYSVLKHGLFKEM